MKSKFLCSLLTLGALFGCAGVTIHQSPIGEVHGTAAGAFLLRCTGERWVGLLPPGRSECPKDQAGNFAVKSLFNLTEISRDLSQLARNAGLDRYCLYTDEGARNPPRVNGLERLDIDCRGVQTMGTWIESSGAPLAASTRAAIGHRPTGHASGRVRLSLLDTVPTTDALSPIPQGATLCSRHGDSLERLAREVACGAGQADPCPVQPFQRLALPEGGRDDCLGGTHGFITQIAQALWDELAKWDQTPAQNRADRLVLNLSLGWDGRLFGGFEQERQMPAPARAVYDALEAVNRRGALVVAAAGNLTLGRPPAHSPLLPAGWEARHPRSPRVFAVSGLDVDGQPLYNSRPGALARRGAFGGPAVVTLDSGGFTPALTGSSVATAVVSSLAAATWARHPEDSPRELMRRLERQGRRLSWRADHALAKGRPRALHLGPGKRQPLAFRESSVVATQRLPALAKGKFTPKHPAYDQAESQPQPSSTPCPNCSVDPPRGPSRAVGSLMLSVELAEDWDWVNYRVTLSGLQIRHAGQTFHAAVGAGPWPNAVVTAADRSLLELQLDTVEGLDLSTHLDAVLLYWTVEKRIGADGTWAVAGEVVSQAIVSK
ncbi:MAG: S8/S53 family peptidase [Thermoanaerobaculia bacterium]|nr:S8/S53 family peptidase [Thermoanaerobaculia bacterium]